MGDYNGMKSPGGGKIVMQGNKMIIISDDGELAAMTQNLTLSEIDKMSVEEVADWLDSIGINPVPFMIHGVSGSELLNLGEDEFEYLKMTPQEIEILQSQLKFVPGYTTGERPEFKDGANSITKPGVPQGVLSSNPAFDTAGTGQVVASKTTELAERDKGMEQELFGAPNTGINFDQYYKIPVETSGRDCPRPISTFDEANFHPHLMSNIRMAQFSAPTPVQKYGIPVVLAKRDLMACAQTGSGKTAAFMFPVISNLLKDGLKDVVGKAVFPRILIMSPTRELACQIYDEGRKFAYRTFIRPTVIYGGASSRGQIENLRQGCQLLIATPGRLIDFCEKSILSLNEIHYLVLDEADRMLDMGFEPQIRKIVDMLPKERQTLMFSATFPVEIQKLAGEFLNDYIFLVVGILSSISMTIKQEILYVEEEDKHAKLLEVCRAANNTLTLIFVQTKKEADTISEYLTRSGFLAAAIHGGMDQWDRENSLHAFETRKKPFLVATDVLQRGLDIPDIAQVVNFDMPAQIEDYVHRIGRTGRAGNEGRAISFFNDHDTYLANGLVKVLSEANQEVPDFIPALATEINSKNSRYKLRSRDARSNMSSSTSYDSGNHSSGGAPAGDSPLNDNWD